MESEYIYLGQRYQKWCLCCCESLFVLEGQNFLFGSSGGQGGTCLSPYSFRVTLMFVLIY